MVYTAILSPQPDPEHGYTAVIPSLPGVVSEGNTRGEAIAAVVEAATLWIGDALAQGEAVPRDDAQRIAAGVRQAIADREAEGWPIRLELTPVEVPVPLVEAA